jgi:photosystem II stability/assembly factor-like uncharacterized protein
MPSQIVAHSAVAVLISGSLAASSPGGLGGQSGQYGTGSAIRLRSVSMVTMVRGWAVGAARGHRVILRTVDGGHHWNDVSPSGRAFSTPRGVVSPSDPHPRAVSIAAPTTNTAYVVRASSGPARYKVWTTHSGGRNWKMKTIATCDDQQPFVTAVGGSFAWISSAFRQLGGGQDYRGPTFGVCRSTTDGGMKWNGPDSHGGGFISPPTFVNGSTGLDQELSYERVVQLPRFGTFAITRTGSSTWNRIHLRPPGRSSGGSWHAALAGDPAFSRSRKMVIPVGFHASTPEGAVWSFAAYVSHDGGTTWSSTHVLHRKGMYTAFRAVFLNASEGWVYERHAKVRKLLRTTDGGRNWVSIKPNLPLAFHDVQFVSERVGFDLTRTSQAEHKRRNVSLLMTRDAGKTWTEVWSTNP